MELDNPTIGPHSIQILNILRPPSGGSCRRGLLIDSNMEKIEKKGCRRALNLMDGLDRGTLQQLQGQNTTSKHE